MKRNSLRAFALLVLASVQFTGFAQQQQSKVVPGSESQLTYKSYPNENGVIRCHTMEMDSIRRANNPGMPSYQTEMMELQKLVVEYKAKQQQRIQEGANAQQAVLLTIPIIYHVFTDGAGAENISAAVVQAQTDQLNLDYRNLSGSPFAVAGDVEIEFCLALVDESGNTLAEPGINRITTYGDGPFSSNDFDNTMKAATQWNPNDYCNIWVADLSGGLLGYAQFPSATTLPNMYPGGAANTDGVVILYSSMGSVANQFYPGPYNLGRTLTHELGHWLGLKHIWGDGGCGASDDCDDTPNSDGSNFGCPTTNGCTDAYTAASPWWPTADPDDMVENYMDYSDDACMNTVTADQGARIRTVFLNSPRRVSLPNSQACAVANADDAGISVVVSPNGTICGSSVDAIVTLQNNGNNDLTSVDIIWDVDGGGATTYNWTGTLTPGSSVDVTLGTLTPTAGAHTFNAATNNPNGTTDSNTANDASSSNFTIVLGGEMITLSINTDCWGEEIYWELLDQGTSNVVASGGNTSGIMPGGQQIGTAQSDPGAYASEALITEQLCVATACYDFVIYDDWGDGLEGTASGCAVDGDWQITDGGGAVIASMSAVNYGAADNANFCLTPPCAATFDTPQTATENCSGDDTGEITVNFTAGNSTGATYDIGAGPQGSNVFSGLAQGSYSITIIDGDACTSTVSVTVSGPSALNANAVDTDISCNGQTDGQIIVSATGGTPTYTYDIGTGAQASGTFSGLGANSYTINVVDGNGCSTSVNGTVAEPAVLGATTGTITPELFGADGSVDISVTGGTAGYTYAWSGPNGYTSTTQDPSNMPGGTYSVTITDAMGCQVTLTNIIVPSELGIDEFGDTKFIIYPNPSNGVFNIQLIDADGVSVNVTDVAGRIVYSNEVSNNTFVVDLTSAANGTYMLNIRTEDNILTKRIVLKK